MFGFTPDFAAISQAINDFPAQFPVRTDRVQIDQICAETRFWITTNYREAYGMHASNGILFNHEGPTRGVVLPGTDVEKIGSGIVF
jgi:GDP-mannose 4,6 dehydratase